MGQAAVRAAITNALVTAQFTGVGAVHAARGYISEQDYEQNAATFYTQTINGSGCVIVVNLGVDDKRMRRADVGRGAVNDTNIHMVVLELFFANKAGDPLQAQFDYDAVVDQVVPFVRYNPTMSAPDTVWSAGEYQSGVVHRQSTPFTSADGTTVFINGVVRFEAWEWITGQVPY
jgi:hypothetical protein